MWQLSQRGTHVGLTCQSDHVFGRRVGVADCWRGRSVVEKRANATGTAADGYRRTDGRCGRLPSLLLLSRAFCAAIVVVVRHHRGEAAMHGGAAKGRAGRAEWRADAMGGAADAYRRADGRSGRMPSLLLLCVPCSAIAMVARRCQGEVVRATRRKGGDGVTNATGKRVGTFGEEIGWPTPHPTRWPAPAPLLPLDLLLSLLAPPTSSRPASLLPSLVLPSRHPSPAADALLSCLAPPASSPPTDQLVQRGPEWDYS
uniref:Uncharacterized protein n=1 Tax=Oryza sativa subsp. japonica TaxID=39947 RepID=Q851I4_ORYSJ|nr:hypothetical protein [Oryza sativa Japonica Group]